MSKAILKRVENLGYSFYCPGCKGVHLVDVDMPNQWGAQWSFNGDMQSPTFSPSVHIVGKCHSFVNSGKIQFLSNCSHALAGQTVDLAAWPY
jgi:hypothetical protein